MRLVLWLLVFLLTTCSGALAQDTGDSSVIDNETDVEEGVFTVTYARPSEAVQAAMARVLEVTAFYLYEESHASMVAPRVCVRHEFRIPEHVMHPRAGQILRIEEGECLLSNPYYVHNPRTHRIYLINEAETIVILESIVALMENAASG